MLITKLSAKFGQSVGLGLDSSASMLYNEIILLRNRRNTIMTKHIILWQLADTLTADEKIAVKAGIKEGLEGLAGQIPGLVDIKVYTEGLPSSNADVMLDSTFESEAALKGYAVHPAHVAVADGKVRPFTKTRLCLDFEV
jgi:hypothetical protein